MQYAYKPLPGPYHFQHKIGDPSGFYHVWKVANGRPIDWLGTIRRTDAGWMGCTDRSRPRLGPAASRKAAADLLVMDRTKIAEENAQRRRRPA